MIDNRKTWAQSAHEWGRDTTSMDFPLAVLSPAMPRQSLRERVKGDAKTLDRKTRKYLTMNAEYIERESWRKRMNEKEPSYKQRLWSLTRHLFTSQSDPHKDRLYPGGYHGMTTADYVTEYFARNAKAVCYA